MAGKDRPHPLYIAFMTAMLVLLAIGVFMLIWGSAHNSIPTPAAPGMFARWFPHA